MPLMSNETGLSRRPDAPPILWAVCFGLAIGNLGILALMTGEAPPSEVAAAASPTDFVGLRTAGRMALEGHAADMYDAVRAKAGEVATFGRDFAGHYPWHYPPQTFLIVAPLGLGTTLAAEIAWVGTTFAACLAVLAAILGRFAPLLLLALPASLSTTVVGQNGFLTASLLGGALLCFEKRPVLAGILIGLLSYKPQFGILVPLALAAGGYWRTFATAAITTVVFALVSVAALGSEPWVAFLTSLGGTGAMLDEGKMGFGKLQSLYGLVRSLGAPVSAALLCQAIFATAAAIWTWRVWRSEALPAHRAAVLLCATAIATPYLYLYDLVILAPAIAFLASRGFGLREAWLIAAALVVLLVYPLIGHSAGMAAPILLAAAIARRLEPSPTVSGTDAQGASFG